MPDHYWTLLARFERYSTYAARATDPWLATFYQTIADEARQEMEKYRGKK